MDRRGARRLQPNKDRSRSIDLIGTNLSLKRKRKIGGASHVTRGGHPFIVGRLASAGLEGSGGAAGRGQGVGEACKETLGTDPSLTDI